jgi:hypothetical protein
MGGPDIKIAAQHSFRSPAASARGRAHANGGATGSGRGAGHLEKAAGGAMPKSPSHPNACCGVRLRRPGTMRSIWLGEARYSSIELRIVGIYA